MGLRGETKPNNALVFPLVRGLKQLFQGKRNYSPDSPLIKLFERQTYGAYLDQATGDYSFSMSAFDFHVFAFQHSFNIPKINGWIPTGKNSALSQVRYRSIWAVELAELWPSAFRCFYPEQHS